MRSVSFLVFCSLGLMAPVLAWAQGTFTGDTVIEAPVELPVGVPVEETLDERIARLKRELREAEQEAKALREAAAQEKRAEREAATPSSALVIVMAAEGGEVRASSQSFEAAHFSLPISMCWPLLGVPALKRSMVSNWFFRKPSS